MANSTRTVRVVRSSVTGRFVPKRRAVTSPKTTQTETIRRKR
jgi:signal recognition particle subunit SEC65